MIEDDHASLFARVRAFEWDEHKRERYWREHRIDFEDARAILDGYMMIRRSDRRNEVRYQIFGYVDGRKIAVVCTIREDRCRIISARRARKDERQKYYGGLAGRAPTGEN